MNEEFLQPSPLDRPDPSSGKPDPGGGKRGTWILLLLFVGCGLGAIYFISRTADPVERILPTPTPAPSPTPTPDPALRLRAEAALEKVVERMRRLRPAEPERWAKERWKSLLSTLEDADKSLADKQFSEAAELYTLLLPELDTLIQELPGLPEKLWPQAVEAYSRGDKDTAVALLQIILFVEPDYQKAKELLPRAENADVSFARLSKTRTLAENAEWDLAWAELNRLKELDDQFPGSAEVMKKVSDALSASEFKKWMTQAYLALEQDDLVSAEALAAKASGFRPEDPSLLNLQQQISDRLIQKNVLLLKRDAEVLASREQWKEAHKKWLEMKALDPGAPWIQTGLDQSLEWKVIDEKITKGLQNPGSEQTGIWIQDMKEREGWPAGLSARAAELEEKRTRMLTPISVTLKSDLETQVEIQRVGRFGTLRTRELKLKPGSYVAKGSRYGYRDVRVPFVVKPGQKELEIEVICVEGI